MIESSKARLLLLYAQVVTGNPTTPAVIAGIVEMEDERITCMNVLEKPFEEIFSAIKSHSLITIDHTIFKGRVNSKGIRHFYRFARLIDDNFFEPIISSVLDSSAQLALLAIDYDIHSPIGGGMSATELERFEIIIWQYVDPPVSTEDVPMEFKDSWMKEGLDPISNWKWITERIPRQIEFTHVLRIDEIRSPMQHRIWDVCVPGVIYSTRKIAMESARSMRLSRSPYHLSDKFIREATGALTQGPHSSKMQDIRFRLRELNMRQQIRLSRSSYTCGSGYEHLVRKYFEIPAFGTPLVAYPLPQIERMGFIDGLNYVAAYPSKFGEIADRIKNDPVLAKRLIANAQQLILRFHTSSIRSIDLIDTLFLVASGECAGGRFYRGRLSPEISGTPA